MFFASLTPAPTGLPRLRSGHPTPAASVRPQVLAIGTSTGGPAALTRLLPLLPGDFTLPVLVVQHMPPVFTQALATRLNEACALSVTEAMEGDALVPGRVLVAPGGYHLRVRRRDGRVVAALDRGDPENACRPAVDVLFRSLAETFGGATLGVVLTGMGQDGLRGAQCLKAHGACVLAESEASSVVWGMPGAVARAGLADATLGLAEIAREIVRRARGQ